jgi:hypothetical protein
MYHQIRKHATIANTNISIVSRDSGTASAEKATVIFAF